MDYLRNLGTQMGYHREGGSTLTVQLNPTSPGPQGWAEMNCLPTATALLGPTHSTLRSAPTPSPQLKTCLVFLDEAHALQRQISQRSHVWFFLKG